MALFLRELSGFLLPAIKPLSYNTKTRLAISLAEIVYENSPLTEMLSGLKVVSYECLLLFTGST